MTRTLRRRPVAGCIDDVRRAELPQHDAPEAFFALTPSLGPVPALSVGWTRRR
jgi:hypothetical protein